MTLAYVLLLVDRQRVYVCLQYLIILNLSASEKDFSSSPHTVEVCLCLFPCRGFLWITTRPLFQLPGRFCYGLADYCRFPIVQFDNEIQHMLLPFVQGGCSLMFVGGHRAPSPGLREFFLLTGKAACRRAQRLPHQVCSECSVPSNPPSASQEAKCTFHPGSCLLGKMDPGERWSLNSYSAGEYAQTSLLFAPAQ